MAVITVPPHEEGFWRVARRPNPLALPEQTAPPPDAPYAGNRFDSALGNYTTLYFATELETCFLETLARLRPAPGFREVIQDDWRQFMEVGAVPADWRQRRVAVRVLANPDFPYLDVEAPETVIVLRDELAETLEATGHQDLDIGVIRGPDRRVTRAISQWAWDQTNDTGEFPLYAGIRYFSKQGRNNECWAVFEDVALLELERRPITLEMDALRSVARTYELTLH